MIYYETYYESAYGLTISRKRAKKLIVEEHGLALSEWALFLEEMGENDRYKATDVLNWLGY